MNRNAPIAVIIGIVALVTIAGCRTGKRTFQARKLNTADDCVQGLPTQVLTLHKVRVQWQSGNGVQQLIDEGRVGAVTDASVQPAAHLEPANQQLSSPAQMHVTTHFCRLPLVYGVDAIGTPIGTDHARLEFYENGMLKKAEEERDHQVDELITSVTEAAEKVIPFQGLERGEGNNPYEFFPPLPADAQIVEILEIVPLQ